MIYKNWFAPAFGRLIPLLLLITACSGPDEEIPEITGSWNIQNIQINGEDRTNELDPGKDRWISFRKDGRFISGGTIGRNTGTFSLADGVLQLDSDAGEQDDSSWKFQIHQDTLVMTGVGTERQENSIVTALKTADNRPLISTKTTFMPSNIRALEIDPDGTVWFAGSGGVTGYSQDRGKTWHTDTLRHEGITPEFRSMAITENGVFILSVADPALLFHTKDMGGTWNLVYSEQDSLVFYDAMEFSDDQFGIAVGDIMNGCLSIIKTTNGGQSWEKIPCDQLPPGLEGEGCFAASDTNLGLSGDHVWIGTTKSRVYHSSDRGSSWEVYDTPIIQGSAMTGIFTLAFYDETTGIVFGGDWENMDNMSRNKAITTDSGKTWQLVGEGTHPGYRSCVQYLPGSNGRELFAVGIPGVSWSPDGGRSWSRLSDTGFYTLRFDQSGTSGWLAGAKKITYLTIDRP